jgi:hypothetical protein
MSTNRLKVLLVSLLAMFAMSATMASAAFGDAGQEFETNVSTIVSTGGPGVLTAGTNIVKCESESDTATGVLGKAKTNFEKVVITFHGCKSEKTGCAATAIKSVGAAGAEEVVTKELTAELAETVLPSAGKTAIIFEGVGVSEVFTELEKNACTVLTKVTGKELCEIKETGRTTGEINCPKPPITEVERSVGDAIVTNSLKAFTASATEEQKATTVQEANKLITGV